jgi:hypothetical protein
MKMLYDSEYFVVVHMQPYALAQEGTIGGAAIAAQDALQLPVLERHGFEIVDKRSGKEVYLDGSWAELFQRHILAWQQNTPTQQEVEDTLEQYAELAQNPGVMH